MFKDALVNILATALLIYWVAVILIVYILVIFLVILLHPLTWFILAWAIFVVFLTEQLLF